MENQVLDNPTRIGVDTMKGLNSLIHARFTDLCKTGRLFRSSLTGQQVWDAYIQSFKNDPMFRDPASSTHNCNLCKNFIRRYGNIVAVDESNNIITMFDLQISGEYQPVVEALSKALKTAPIKEVFFETFDELNELPYEKCAKTNSRFQLGMASNVKRYTKEEADKFGVVKPNQTITFDHMHLFLPAAFVDNTGKSVESIMADYRQMKEVFQRGMETIPVDTLELVIDLINQGSLLDGPAHIKKLQAILPLKKEYDTIPASQKDNWCWVKSYKLGIADFRNHVIGTLCVDLAEGVELNKACQSWNKKVDPVNYMKTTAPITQKQIAEAKEYVEANNYAESFDRRFATIDDIKVSEILHTNTGKDEIKSVSIFDGVKATTPSRHKRSEFDGVEEIGIEKFMKDVLPGCTSIEVLLQNIHENNMVSLTTAKNPDSKPIFKWDNNYSWTFNGNLAGKSQIKQAVKDAGGNVEGVLNFRLAWNDGPNANDNSDLDAWVQQPDGVQIGFSTEYRKDKNPLLRTTMSGQLDVDNTSPNGKMAVENITWTQSEKMRDGIFKFWVNQWAARNSQGFKVEIEFDGETYCYEYNRPISDKANVAVAEVVLKDGKFSIKHLLPEVGGSASKEIYGLETNKFHRVNLICLSPNHWGQNSVGNKHYLFMLHGCKAPGKIRSFHNENLIPELLQHRKVMEVLGATSNIESTDKQLSGLGFNATVRDEVIARLSGSHKRTVRIKF